MHFWYSQQNIIKTFLNGDKNGKFQYCIANNELTGF